MDAYAYLVRHGWSGPGNPLNPDRAGVRGGLGLTKPLLVARRSGNSGVGNRTTKDPTNQWWLRGFEDALKGIGKESDNAGASAGGNALTSELYRFFVKGEAIPGTLGGMKSEKEKEKNVLGKRKRGEDDGKTESKEERRLRKEEKRRKKVEKEERREQKKERKLKKAEEKAEKKKRKTEKDKKPEDDYPTPVSIDLDSTDGQDGGSTLDAEKLEKLKKKEKKDKKEKKKTERKKDKASTESKKSKKRESYPDESSKRKSKKSESS